MKTLVFATLLVAFGVILAGCNTTANVNTSSNFNRSNSNTYATGTTNNNNSGSTVGNMTNSVANSVSSMTTESPESFLSDAIQASRTEVEAGKAAGTKSKNADIKKFAQMMVTDHSKANSDIEALAKKKTFNLPTGLGSNQSTFDKLNTLNGDDFDREFIDTMVSDHQKVIDMFQKQSQNSADPDVKALAAKMLPVLQKHLDAAKDIQAKMK